MSTARNRNLLIIITVLLLTNVGMLVYFLGQKKEQKIDKPEARLSVTEMLQQEVGFNDDQAAKYKEMKEKQKERIRPMYESMRRAKDSLFRLLSFPATPDSVINTTADLIARRQKEIDTETFNHFRRVRTLCTPAQESKYDSMVLKMFRKMGRQPRQGEGHKDAKGN